MRVSRHRWLWCQETTAVKHIEPKYGKQDWGERLLQTTPLYNARCRTILVCEIRLITCNFYKLPVAGCCRVFEHGILSSLREAQVTAMAMCSVRRAMGLCFWTRWSMESVVFPIKYTISVERQQGTQWHNSISKWSYARKQQWGGHRRWFWYVP